VRGDLYRLRSDKDTRAHEQRGPRFAVAVQSDDIQLSTVIVAPTSTSAQPAIFRPEIELDSIQTRVLVDQMRAVDASRLGDFAGRLDTDEIAELDRAVRLMLGVLLLESSRATRDSRTIEPDVAVWDHQREQDV
jgi:mRNA interferase MazF